MYGVHEKRSITACGGGREARREQEGYATETTMVSGKVGLTRPLVLPPTWCLLFSQYVKLKAYEFISHGDSECSHTISESGHF